VSLDLGAFVVKFLVFAQSLLVWRTRDRIAARLLRDVGLPRRLQRWEDRCAQRSRA